MQSYLYIFMEPKDNLKFANRLFINVKLRYSEWHYEDLINFIHSFRKDINNLNLEKLNSTRFETLTSQWLIDDNCRIFKYFKVDIEENHEAEYENEVEDDGTNSWLSIKKLNKDTILIKGRVRSFLTWLESLEDAIDDALKGTVDSIHFFHGYGSCEGYSFYLREDTEFIQLTIV